MIGSFVDTWPLFQHAYVSGWLIGLLLALIGVLVVARDQIFIGAAVSEASMLGIAVGIWLGNLLSYDAHSWWHSDLFHSAMGGLFAVLAALLTAGGSRGHETHEALTGWVFLVSVSLSILLMAHSPIGMEEINRLSSSTIIGARPADVWVFAALLLVTATTLWGCSRQALLLVIDPAMARAVGLRVELGNGLIAVWLGLAVGFSIHVSGVVFSFANLVLPALAAKNICRESRQMFVVAPVVSLATGVPAFVLANHYDSPPGQMAAAGLCLLVVAGWLVRQWRMANG